ncbi:MAG: YjbE family putative metal transport protein, partial [Gammaproteobacteria bacterium]|nr:YjbE family putative metal transport protein [Gammaproteobacteria bacterium]
MEYYLTLEAGAVFLQVIFVDLILAADNAIIVAMVASRVPEDMRQRVILFGIGAAVVMRIGFSLIAIQLMAVPGIKLLGGARLIWVCWKLWQEIRGSEEETEVSAKGEQLTTLRSAIIQIVIADLSMSIDNVIAIAGVSRD